ncbi:hypothetical protein BC830DRAFT_1101197 [Chytriomyces sp. MP71]|nr:hypothetical protein BC830DRAFT_1101197 [Chytriomyces sp. MP71]
MVPPTTRHAISLAERHSIAQHDLFRCLSGLLPVPPELVLSVLRKAAPLCCFCRVVHDNPTEDTTAANGFADCYGCSLPCAPCTLREDWRIGTCRSCSRPLCNACSSAQLQKRISKSKEAAFEAITSSPPVSDFPHTTNCGNCAGSICSCCYPPSIHQTMPVTPSPPSCKGCDTPICAPCARLSERNRHLICRKCMDDSMEWPTCFAMCILLFAFACTFVSVQAKDAGLAFAACSLFSAEARATIYCI